MQEMEQLAEKIRELREYLHSLVDKKKDLLDEEIVYVSKMLDVHLFEYEKLLIKMEEEQKLKNQVNIK